jgi:hypothetical protein
MSFHSFPSLYERILWPEKFSFLPGPSTFCAWKNWQKIWENSRKGRFAPKQISQEPFIVFREDIEENFGSEPSVQTTVLVGFFSQRKLIS